MNNRITLTTWNALGGQWGLTANERRYNPNWLNGIDGTHFYRHDDIVARLGGNHVGGKKIMLLDPEIKMEAALAAHMKPELEQALLHGVSVEKDPLYAFATRYTREFLGTALAGIINLADHDIEGLGIINLTRTVLHATLGQGAVVAAVEAGAFLWQYFVQRIADFTLREKDGLKTAIVKIAEAASGDKRHFKWFAEKIIESVEREVTNTLGGATSLDRESMEWISGVLEDAAAKTTQRDPEISNLLRNASRRIQDRLPGLPLALGNYFLIYGPGLSLVQMGMKTMLAKLQEQFAKAEREDKWAPIVRLSPLALDLDGDGIETVGTEYQVYFDHNGNGYAELTGWIDSDDGLLTYDRNQNGSIDSGNELFGNHFQLSVGGFGHNGFVALADLDSDSNQLIDSNDTAWDRLGIWQDFNFSGKVDPGELNSLAHFGVKELSLSYTSGEGIDWNGNDHRQEAEYIREDGSTSQLTDVWFITNSGQSQDLNVVPVEQDLSFVPDLEGSGNVPSLHQAIIRDKSGELGRLLKRWYEVPHTQHVTLIESLIYHWAGVAHQGSGNPRLLSDQRILSALEAFTGRPYRNGNEPINVNSSFILTIEFQQICRHVTGLLNSHPYFHDTLSKARMSWDGAKNKIAWNVEPLLEHLREQSDHKLTASNLYNLKLAILSLGETGTDLLDALRSQIVASPRDKDLKLRWLVDNQIVTGSDESEVLHPGISFPITIHGGGGNDHIKTHQSGDLIDGGEGDDILDGDLGNDIYLFDHSFGKDRIHEAETHGRGFDTAIFLGHASSDVEVVTQQKGDLILRFRDGNELTVARYAGDSYLFQRIDLFRFADGVEWRQPDVLSRIAIAQPSPTDDILAGQRNTANRIDGLAGNDLIWGGDKEDQLSGHLGHDVLFGGDGDDWLRGGRGRDLIVGGGGRDRYLFAKGDGEDTIRAKGEGKPEDRGTVIFDASVLPTKVTVALDGDRSTLLLASGLLGDKIRVEEFFLDGTPYHARNPIESVLFSDGTSWNTWDILQRAMRGTAERDRIEGSVYNDSMHGYAGNDYLNGMGGNDQIFGNEGDDTLEGNTGDDLLYGGLGTNRFRFGRGHGQDVITADLAATPTQRSGIIQFDQSIHPDEISMQRWGSQLLITLANSVDSLTVQEFFRDNNPANPWNPISGIEFFSTNQKMAVQDILLRLANGLFGTEGNDTLAASALTASTLGTSAAVSYLHGLGGDDSLAGSDGEDLLDGGDGVDSVSYALAPRGVVVDLSLRAPQNTQGAGWDTLASIENLVGSRFADHLSGSDDANRLDGGDGDDILVGSAGADRHKGGAGADLFLYRSALEAGQGVRGRDRILDFGSEDRLDLSLIDANLSRPGDQPFAWIGDREFSAPGQLRYSVLNGQGLLKGNVIGSSSPEFTLVLEGGFQLDPSIHLVL
jgi:Ca2+-binding RTX toxin-like protein